MKTSAVIVLATLVVTLTGCNIGPKYHRPNYQVPLVYRGADNLPVSSDSASSLGDKKWAEVFREPELQALINQAIDNNYDLHIAAQRILEQQQQVRITRSQAFPQISAGGSGIGAEFPGNLGSNISSPITLGSLNLSVAWTPDFWGIYRKQTEAARAQLLQQVWAQRAVRMTLIQQVVTTYLQLRALDRQLEISQQTLKVRQDSVNLTSTLEAGGANPLSDVRQAEQLLYTASSQIPQLQQQIQQNENNLQLLLGANPGPVAHTDPNALTPPPQNLPTGLPSQLLERRPDIQEAEAQLIAANANIGVARANLFPQFSISASGGVGGQSFSDFFNGGPTVYGIGSLAQPIFNGGKLRGQVQLTRETQTELVFNYRKTIVTALRDVSNALIALQKEHDYRIEQEKLVAAAQDATRLARLRYQGGATSYLEVLTTDSNLFSAQLNLASAQQGEAVTLVTLYTALGGGWQ